MKKIKLIYNSMAGQNRFKHSLDDIIGRFNLAGFEVAVYKITKGADPTEFILDSKDAHAIVVAGGDGTLNKIVNIIMKNNVKVPLGVIPAGTSNDFAAHIGMPADFKRSVDKILNNEVEKVDVGLVNGTYFINVLTAGLFSSTPYKTDKRLKDAFGKASYFMTAVKQPFSYKPFYIKIEAPGYIIEEKTAVFVVLNGGYVGTMSQFSKGTSIQDGKLDMIILRDCKVADYIKIIAAAGEGNHLDNENVIYLRESEFKISLVKGSCDTPDVDGDEGPEFPLNVTCIKDGLNLFL